MNDDDEDGDAEMTVMPWGRHEGQLVSDLPSTYLCWLQGVEIWSARLAQAIDRAHRKHCTMTHDSGAWR